MSDTLALEPPAGGAGGPAPLLLRLVGPLLADPADIRREALALLARYDRRGGGAGGGGAGGSGRTLPDDSGRRDARDRAARKLISRYAYLTGMAGGATALVGVVPGLGTVLAATGGAAADAALTMKWQVEMVMGLATLYGYDVRDRAVGHLCYVIAGLGVTAEAGKEGAKRAGVQAFVRLVRAHLKGDVLVEVRRVFGKAGLPFTRKRLEKGAPFGIGVLLGFSTNRALTRYVGHRARVYFETS